eukprot:scaffold11830_cov48-Phaeocystis_antarctica.AAC.1
MTCSQSGATSMPRHALTSAALSCPWGRKNCASAGSPLSTRKIAESAAGLGSVRGEHASAIPQGARVSACAASSASEPERFRPARDVAAPLRAPGSAQSNDSQSSNDAGRSVPEGRSMLPPPPGTPPPCDPGPPNSKSASSIWSDVFRTEGFLPPTPGVRATGTVSSSSLPSGCVVLDRCRRFWNHTWLGLGLGSGLGLGVARPPRLVKPSTAAPATIPLHRSAQPDPCAQGEICGASICEHCCASSAVPEPPRGRGRHLNLSGR